MAADPRIRAWHFTTADRRLGYGDGRLVAPGQTLTVDCTPALCEAGLHASRSILDALSYAPGPYVWRVEVGGEVTRGDDKLVGTTRTALWGVDATDVLRAFARRCALDVVHLWDPPDVVAEYLRTGREDLRAAARAAAWDAARAAARDAARAAARAAAWAAARDAARSRQRRRLTSMIVAEAKRQEVSGG